RPSSSSRRQEAHSIPKAFSGKKIRASLPRLLREIGLGSWFQCASEIASLRLDVSALVTHLNQEVPSAQSEVDALRRRVAHGSSRVCRTCPPRPSSDDGGLRVPNFCP